MPVAKPISALDDHLGYRLRLISNHVSSRFARRIEAEGVTVAEWVMLRFLFDADALAPSALAARMGMTRGAISKLADRLLAKQMIERSDSADDARTHTLRLAKKGRTLVPRLAGIADQNDRAVFSTLTVAERASLQRLLDKLAEKHQLKGAPIA